jgi:leader peptidase (prepilin peptidase)/N-methyltransferase
MTLEAVVAALFGLLLGSFLNVCIWRWPRDLSVAWPGSHCSACGHAIAAYDNIPVLSYFLLRGRCRHCLAAFSWRYPTVELLTGLFFGAAVLLAGPTPAAAKLAAFAWLQIGLIFADLETRLLPDQFTIGGIVLGIGFSALAPSGGGLSEFVLHGAQPWLMSLFDSAFTAAFASASLFLIGAIYSRIRHREGLGFGDVKMVAMIGAFLGLAPTLMTVFAGSLLGAVAGLGYIFLSKKDAATYQLPFASFLGIAGLLVAFYPK